MTRHATAFQAVVLLATAHSARCQSGHAGHGHDHSAHGTVPDAFKTRGDYISAAHSNGAVAIIGSSPEYWSAMPSSPQSYTVVTGTALTFRFSVNHNLYLMETQAAYDSCDLSHSVELAETNVGGRETDQPSMPINKYEVVITTAGTYYFACHVVGHCGAGQKITVTVEDPPSPPNPPAPPPGTADGGGGFPVVVVIIAAVAAVVLIGGGVAAYCFVKSKKPTATTTVTTPQAEMTAVKGRV